MALTTGENEKSFLQNLQEKIKNEIDKTKYKKLSELSKLETEVLQIIQLTEKHKLILSEELETFYNSRLKSLEDLLKGSDIFKNESETETESKHVFKEIKKKNQERMLKEFLEYFDKETKGSAEFYPSSTNKEIVVGSVSLPNRKSINLSTSDPELNYSITEKNLNYFHGGLTVHSCEKSILGIFGTKSFHRNIEIWDLEEYVKVKDLNKKNNCIIRLEDNEIFDNPLTIEIALNSDKVLSRNNKMLYRKKNLDFKTITCSNDYAFWLNKEELNVFGPNIDHYKSLPNEKVNDSIELKEFLKEIFLKKTDILIGSSYVFIIYIDDMKAVAIKKTNFLENLYGYRRVNIQKISLVFFDDDRLKTVFIEKNT